VAGTAARPVLLLSLSLSLSSTVASCNSIKGGSVGARSGQAAVNLCGGGALALLSPSSSKDVWKGAVARCPFAVSVMDVIPGENGSIP
jgi:hypothetical protein